MNNKINSRNQPLAGACFVLASSFIFAVASALVKKTSLSLPSEMVVFFRNFYAFLFILPWILNRRTGKGIKTKNFRLHLIRCISGLSAMYCFFYAIAHLQLAEAVLLSFTSPIFIPFIAYLWIKEPVSYQTGSAILIGFVGVVLILRPGSELFQGASFVGLTAGIFVALSMVCIRRMSSSEPPTRIVFYFNLLSMLISAVPLLWCRQFPKGEMWWLLLLIGLLATLGQLLMTKGYSLAPAAQAGPFSYGIVIFSSLIGWIFWDESLGWLTWAGAALICIAGIMTAYRSKSQVVPAVPGHSVKLKTE